MTCPEETCCSACMSQVNHNTIPVIADPALQSFEGVGKSVSQKRVISTLSLFFTLSHVLTVLGDKQKKGLFLQDFFFKTHPIMSFPSGDSQPVSLLMNYALFCPHVCVLHLCWECLLYLQLRSTTFLTHTLLMMISNLCME